jgi:hypothetical protein
MTSLPYGQQHAVWLHGREEDFFHVYVPCQPVSYEYALNPTRARAISITADRPTILNEPTSHTLMHGDNREALLVTALNTRTVKSKPQDSRQVLYWASTPYTSLQMWAARILRLIRLSLVASYLFPARLETLFLFL